ncbi:hypothetical protein ACQYZY_28935 [Pseudomonas aeruginosa]|jgi:hypothetical protein|uniref:hypothetical protein n=1 Tax=Pseudomonas aeruginosa TaxID=287 RepID=UPI0022DD3359|nr:hypothetical protein [Pseudomonas aeruginosa]WBM10980.1 hypothetical protein M1V28_31745 [Pseudomonas aeruginosa]HCL4132428.1 hypothetical protein [Pseudomonas aeruginosa]
MRANVRNKELLESFTRKLELARAARGSVLDELVARMTFIESELSELGARMQERIDHSTRTVPKSTWFVQWAWRAHRNPRKVMPIEIYLVTEQRGGDSVKQSRLSLRIRGERVARLEPYLGPRAAKLFSKDLDRFLVLANTVVAWINALAPQEAHLLNEAPWSYGLGKWIGLVGGICEKAALTLAGTVEQFLALDAELDDLVFEFNAALQPVRFHSIICRRDCPTLDRLAPAEPRFRVVVSLNRKTGRRSSRDVQLYKADLAVERLAAGLSRSLGREPSVEEIAEARAAQRSRSPNPWLTAELIQHCWLGKHSSGLLSRQKKMVAVMEKWRPLRDTIQSLL